MIVPDNHSNSGSRLPGVSAEKSRSRANDKPVGECLLKTGLRRATDVQVPLCTNFMCGIFRDHIPYAS